MATQLSELFFQTLSDPQKRQQYDDFGYTAADAGSRQQRGQGHGFHGFQPFESFFGGGRGFEFKFNFDDFGGGFGGGESLIDKYRINLRFAYFHLRFNVRFAYLFCIHLKQNPKKAKPNTHVT